MHVVCINSCGYTHMYINDNNDQKAKWEVTEKVRSWTRTQGLEVKSMVR